MRLIVIHYHLRPGGVRRVIEMGAAHLVRASGLPIHSVTLATGEAADAIWQKHFAKLLMSVPVDWFIEPAFSYCCELHVRPERIAARIRAAMNRLLHDAGPDNTVVWIHNPAIARNLLLIRELAGACAARGVPLVAHHHDWWFDNRWRRWRELRDCGFRTLAAAARAALPAHPNVRHVVINRADGAILTRHFHHRIGWLPNLTEPAAPPPAASVRRARRWLRAELALCAAPMWLLPCRFLRRKNVGEALLLTRWLRQEAWLVTTGGVSSADEQACFERLQTAARRNQWRLRLGVLAGAGNGAPSVEQLLAVSEAVLLTSVQEGFGLPYLEAAAAGRPLLARSLPNIAPDLAQFGFRFPQLYDDVLVDAGLFDWDAEVKRQARLFGAWLRQMPRTCRAWTGTPCVLTARKPAPVPFSRLTLTAQLEVLAVPAGESWRRSAPLNPWLAIWHRRAESGRLQVAGWPRRAGQWLNGRAYARRFRDILKQPSHDALPANVSCAAQREFIRNRLNSQNLFPLLWSRES